MRPGERPVENVDQETGVCAGIVGVSAEKPPFAASAARFGRRPSATPLGDERVVRAVEAEDDDAGRDGRSENEGRGDEREGEDELRTEPGPERREWHVPF